MTVFPVSYSSYAITAENASGPAQPNTVLEALEQRMAKYKEAFTQAKASGDERKSRMHDRIAKVSTPDKLTPKPQTLPPLNVLQLSLSLSAFPF